MLNPCIYGLSSRTMAPTLWPTPNRILEQSSKNACNRYSRALPAIKSDEKRIVIRIQFEIDTNILNGLVINFKGNLIFFIK